MAWKGKALAAVVAVGLPLAGFVWLTWRLMQPRGFDEVQRQYARMRTEWHRSFRYPIDPRPLPADGVGRLRAAARAAQASTHVVFVRLLPSYEAALYRRFDTHEWVLSGELLLTARPQESPAPISEPEALRWAHYHASAWLKEHSSSSRCDRLLWQTGAMRRPDGSWDVGCGMAAIAGWGLHLVVGPDGSLVSIELLHSPE